MDGPNVNLAFRKKLFEDLEQNFGTTILDTGTCSLHIVSNAFLRVITEIKPTVD